jgi:hypothetical protein
MEMKLPWKFAGEYWLSEVKIRAVRRWVRKSRHSGGNLALDDRPRSRGRVGAADDLNEFLRQPRAEKLSIVLTSVSEITAGLGYENKCVLDGCGISLSPK